MSFIPIDFVLRGGHFALGSFTQLYCFRHYLFLFCTDFRNCLSLCEDIEFIVWWQLCIVRVSCLPHLQGYSPGGQFQSCQATVCAVYSPIFPPFPPGQKLFVSSMFDFLQTMTLPKKQSGACPFENS
jgi:hypothetical protein